MYEIVYYTCPSCGASMAFAFEETSRICPFCSNNAIAEDKYGGDYAPEKIIPFALDRKDAERAYKSYIEQAMFLPKDWGTHSKVLSTSGVYVPFDLYTGKASFTYARKDAMNAPVYMQGMLECERVPADTSLKLDDDLAVSILPYDLSKVVDFSPVYLPGFSAEIPTQVDAETKRIMHERIGQACRERAFVPQQNRTLDEAVLGNEDISNFDSGVESAFREKAVFPIWVLVVEYKGEKHLVGINGQTSKVASDLPFGNSRTKMLRFLLGGLFACIAMLVMLLLFTSSSWQNLPLAITVSAFSAAIAFVAGTVTAGWLLKKRSQEVTGASASIPKSNVKNFYMGIPM